MRVFLIRFWCVLTGLAAGPAISNAATSAGAIVLNPGTELVLVHGGHSICAAGHRHDWEGRKIKCRAEDYIFRDGPLPVRKQGHKRPHRK